MTNKSRRAFLKRSATLAATAAVAPLLPRPTFGQAPAAPAVPETLPVPPTPIPPVAPEGPMTRPAAPLSATDYVPTLAEKAFPADAPIAPGPFQPDWDSLHQYEFPEWFQDAKFGIWAHWGPQCQPECGDWYARNLYEEYNAKGQLNGDYVNQCTKYGHPADFGFKDNAFLWKAQNWDPEQLIGLYKKAGAKYFMALGNHHDNFDTWDSKYQPWNSVAIGPKKDLIGGWARAARAEGLPFGVSVHAGRSWGWYEVSRGADKNGPLAGVPYDGNLTVADGKGQWWEGLDPQDLYNQNHAPGAKPSPDYMRKFSNRVIDLVNQHHPELLYFDDDYEGGLPLFHEDPSIGLRIAAHHYNTNVAVNGGKLTALIAAKKLTPDRRECLLYDIERGVSNSILPQPWQSETCIGQWHYSLSLAQHNGYKKSPEIIHLLADIVSKNGNFMLNIPVRSDGTIDDHERQFLSELTEWMDVNGEGIYATRPWSVYGEGPVADAAAAANPAPDSPTPKLPDPTPDDIRYTRSKDGTAVYALVMGWPAGGQVTLRSCAAGSPSHPGPVRSVVLLGSPQPTPFTRDAAGLHVTLPAQPPGAWANSAIVLKIT